MIREYLSRIFGSGIPEPELEVEAPPCDPRCCPKCGQQGIPVPYHAATESDDNYLCVSDSGCGTYRAEPPQDAFSE